ncbi:UNVERIFIED_CONTAM: hypothetical protein ITH36_24330, partial [Salmonella enterica subsp. enterica serovar Weltevreden]
MQQYEPEGHQPIRIPRLDNNNFEIRNSLISLITNRAMFHGYEDEDPYDHISLLSSICKMQIYKRISQDNLKLMVFEISLDGDALKWFHTLPHHSITSWDDMLEVFYTKYFPPAKMMNLREKITTYRQFKGEDNIQSWRRFKRILKRCRDPDMSQSTILHCFYRGLSTEFKSTLNNSSRGSFMSLHPEDRVDILEQMEKDALMWDCPPEITRDDPP